MEPGIADEERRVSYHAVARYVQRILKIEITTTSETSKELAEAYAAAAGLSVSEIRGRIWSKGISAAVAMGFPQCATRQFVAVIAQPQGVIATILEPRHRDTVRLKLLSENEMRSKASRIGRRKKACRLALPDKEGEEA